LFFVTAEAATYKAALDPEGTSGANQDKLVGLLLRRSGQRRLALVAAAAPLT
jgi:hypothetical protein